jgi:hypothetical protein
MGVPISVVTVFSPFWELRVTLVMRAAAWMSVPGRLAATTLPTVTVPVGVKRKFSMRVCLTSSCSPSARSFFS